MSDTTDMTNEPTARDDEQVGHDEQDEALPAASDARGPVEHGELVDVSVAARHEREPETNSVTEPAKVMRIGSMIKQLLEEVRNTELDEAGRHRLREIYEMDFLFVTHPTHPIQMVVPKGY